MHTNIHRKNSKKPGAHCGQHTPGLKFGIHITSRHIMLLVSNSLGGRDTPDKSNFKKLSIPGLKIQKRAPIDKTIKPLGIHLAYIHCSTKMCFGESGHRSQYLLHAKQALYHLS